MVGDVAGNENGDARDEVGRRLLEEEAVAATVVICCDADRDPLCSVVENVADQRR
jgi:hypothetical protein